VKRAAAAGLALAMLGAPLLDSDWVVRRPISAVRTGTFGAQADESSGVAASARRPDLFWTILDSGNPAEIIAIDSAARVHGRVRLGGAVNADWEAIALGACPAGTCVYVGDIGDNLGRRRSVVVYRLPEPDPGAAGGAPVRPAEAIEVEYPDGARDAEAMVVTPAGDLVIVTKGLLSAVKAYRVPADAWSADRRGPAVAEDLGPLPIAPRSALGRWVTDASLAPDGRVAIRTYRDIFLFVLAPDGTLRRSEPPTLCDISGLETQGEGITWARDSTMLLTSEASRRAAGTIHSVRCPWP
jgi:hypothetical protein